MIVRTVRTTRSNPSLPHRPLLVVSLFLLMIGAIAPGAAQVQTASSGRDFYVAYPSLATSTQQVLRVSITAVRAASVDITFMENDSTAQFLLDAGEVRELVIAREKLMLNRDEYVSRRTLHIASTDLITVLVTNDAHALSDGYSAPPTPALGFSYVAMSYAAPPENDIYRGLLAIIATDDQTDVRVTPSVNTLGGHIAGTSYSRRLNRGEVYQIVPREAGAADITGTRVESSKPVVVLSGHESTTVRAGVSGAANSLLEAMPPVVDWGQTYYALPLPGATEALFRVVAQHAATDLYLNGLRVATLGAGGIHEFKADAPVQIRATGPVLAAQYTVHALSDTVPTGDPSMMILNPVEFYADAFLWSTPALPPRVYRREDAPLVVPFKHYVVITASADVRGSVQLDGRPVDLNIPYSSGSYYSAIVRVEPGPHRLAASGPLNAQLVGMSEYDAYSMPAGVRLRDPLRGGPLVVRSCRESLDTTLVLANVGTDQIEIVRVDFPPGMAGSLLSPSLPAIVQTSGVQNLRLRFSGLPYGTRSGRIMITTTTSAGHPLLIPVEITRDSSAIVSLEDSLLFSPATAAVPSRDSTITVVNSGSGPVTIAEAIATGPFRVIAPSLPQVIAEGDTLHLTVRFTPPVPGEHSGEITFRPSPCGAPVSVALRGRKLRPAAIEVRVDSVPSLPCSDASPQVFAAVIYNSGEEDLAVDSIKIASAEPGEFVIPATQTAGIIQGGDSLAVLIRFQPAGFGLRSAVLRVWSPRAVGGYLVIPVTVRRERAGATVSVPALDFGTVQGCEPGGSRTFRITNSGTIPLAIDSFAVSTGDFQPQGERAMTIGVGESRDVEVLFVPRGSGPRHDTLRIYGTPCGLLAVLGLAGEQKGADLAIESDTIDFGTVALCELPHIRSLTISNTGAFPDTVLSVEAEGTGFTIGSFAPAVLSVGEERTISVRFDAPGPGTFEAVLLLRASPCGIVRRAVLRGTAVEMTAPLVADISFTGAALPARRSVVLSNANALPLVVNRLEFQPEIPGLRAVAPDFPLVVPPGGVATIELEYSGTAEFRTEASLLIGGPCPMRGIVRVVRGEQPEILALELSFPDTAAAVDQHIAIPLRLLSSSPFEGNITVGGTIQFDRTMLSADRLSTPVPGGSIDITDELISPGLRTFRFRYTGPLPADGTLALVESFVLLGLSDTTSLRIMHPTAAPEPGMVETVITGRDGFFRTLGICRTGGDRFIRLQEMSKLAVSVPNPASDWAAIRFEIPAGGPVLLRLFNGMGEEVARPVEGELAAGSHEIRIDLRALPSGLYSYELRSGSGVLRETMIVRK